MRSWPPLFRQPADSRSILEPSLREHLRVSHLLEGVQEVLQILDHLLSLAPRHFFIFFIAL